MCNSPKKCSSTVQRRLIHGVAGIFFSLPALAEGQISGTWTGLGTTTDFSDAYNWSSFPNVPGGGGEISNDGSYRRSVPSLSQNVQISRIRNSGPTLFALGGSGSSITFSGASEYSTNVGLGTSATFFRGGDLIGARIHGSAGLTKTGPGVLSFSGNPNFYEGGTRILGGWIVPNSNLSLGPTNQLLTLDGGGLRMSGDYSTRPIQLGLGGGSISTLSLSIATLGSVSGPGALSIEVDPLGAGAVEIIRDVAHQGPTTILNGLILVRPTAGRLSATSRITLSSNLQVGDGSGMPTNLVNDAADIALRGGVITFAATAATPERIAVLRLESGRCVTSGTFTADALQRAEGAVWNLGGSSQPSFLSAPATTGDGLAGQPDIGVLPYAVGTLSTPVTFDAGKVRPLTTAEQHTLATLPSPQSPTMNLRVGAETSSEPVSVRSLTLTAATFSGAAVAVNGGGVYLRSGTSVQLSNAIDFGDSEGFFHTASMSVLSGNISGTAGVTFSGSVAPTGQNTYTGPTYVNGTLEIRSSVLSGTPNPLGLDSSPVVIQAGSDAPGVLSFNNTVPGSLVIERDLKFISDGRRSSRLLPSDNATVTINGDVEIAGVLRVNQSVTPHNTQPVRIIGNVSGAGILAVDIGAADGSPGVTLSGTNTFAGGVELAGHLGIGSDQALGTGSLRIETVTRSSIDAVGAARTLPNSLLHVGSGTLIFGGSHPLTFNGVSTLGTIVLNGSNPLSFAGGAYDTSINTQGTGTLELAWYRGTSMNVPAARLEFIAGENEMSSRAGTLSIGATAVVDLNDHTLILDRGGGTITGGEAGVLGFLSSGRLISTVATNTPGTGIGYALVADAIGTQSGDPPAMCAGQLVREHDLIIRYTLLGDANLDGNVSITDFARLAANFNLAGAFWSDGNFNHDGATGIADFALLASNFNQSLPFSRSAIPEPAGFVGIGLFTLAMRKRSATSLRRSA